MSDIGSPYAPDSLQTYPLSRDTVILRCLRIRRTPQKYLAKIYRETLIRFSLVDKTQTRLRIGNSFGERVRKNAQRVLRPVLVKTHRLLFQDEFIPCEFARAKSSQRMRYATSRSESKQTGRQTPADNGTKVIPARQLGRAPRDYTAEKEKFNWKNFSGSLASSSGIPETSPDAWHSIRLNEPRDFTRTNEAYNRPGKLRQAPLGEERQRKKLTRRK